MSRKWIIRLTLTALALLLTTDKRPPVKKTTDDK